MFKKPLFLEMFLLLATVGVLNHIAYYFNLYWSVNEFDSVVHFLGGAALSIFFLWLYFFSGFFNSLKRNFAKFLFISIFGSMFIAISWEIFELFLGEAVINGKGYSFDVTLDLIMGFLGAVAACFYGYLRELRKRVPPLSSLRKEKVEKR